MTSAAYMLPSNLSEKQIEADVSNYFGWCSPLGEDPPFRLLDVDEQLTGADKKFDVAMPLFLQFKRSAGLARLKQRSTRKNKSKLQCIREFRADEKLADDPTLYFQLRAKATNAKDFQHNVLLSYERPPDSRAIYVAPLTLDRDEYATKLWDSCDRHRLFPFTYDPEWIFIRASDRVRLFRAIPFLRAHISIPPHERVTTHEHFYSFDGTGVDVAWHSDKVISREPSRLSDFMATFVGRTLNDELRPLDDVARTLQEVASLHDGVDVLVGDGPLERLLAHGRWLGQSHNIRQILFVGRSQRLAELRRRAG